MSIRFCAKVLACTFLQVLGCGVWFGFRSYAKAIESCYGQAVASVMLVLTACQFHLPFYASRTLPNIFAVSLTRALHSSLPAFVHAYAWMPHQTVYLLMGRMCWVGEWVRACVCARARARLLYPIFSGSGGICGVLCGYSSTSLHVGVCGVCIDVCIDVLHVPCSCGS